MVSATLHAIRDSRLGQLHVLSEQLVVNNAESVFVLCEPAITGPQIGSVHTTQDLKRRQLPGLWIERSFVGHNFYRLVFNDRARQHDRKRLAASDTCRGRSPPT